MSGIPYRELGVEDVVSWTIRLYRGRFTTLFGAFLAASIPGIITGAIVLAPMLDYMNSYVSNAAQVAYTKPLPFDGNMITLGIVTAVVYGFAELFAYGFAVVVSSAEMKGEAWKPSAFLRDTYRKFWKYIGATIIMMLGFLVIFLVPFVFMFMLGSGGALLGVILFFVDFFAIIYLMIRLSIFSQTVYLEDNGAVASLRKSFDLLDGRIILTLIVLIVLYVIAMISSVLVGQVTGLLGAQLWYVSALLSLVATAFAAPIVPIGLTVWYYSMKARLGETTPPTPAIVMTPGAPPPMG